MATGLDCQSYTDSLVSLAAATGLFVKVNAHEPANAPNAGLTASVWVDSIDPVPRVSGLNETAVRITFNIRIYQTLLAESLDAIDPAIIAAVDALMAALSSEFALAGTVMEVDLLGAYGTPLAAKAGYLNTASQPMRVVTITVPLVVDNVWGQAP